MGLVYQRFNEGLACQALTRFIKSSSGLGWTGLPLALSLSTGTIILPGRATPRAIAMMAPTSPAPTVREENHAHGEEEQADQEESDQAAEGEETEEGVHPHAWVVAIIGIWHGSRRGSRTAA